MKMPARRTKLAASSFGQVNIRSARKKGVLIPSTSASRAARLPPSRRTSSQRASRTVQLKVIIASRKAMNPCGSNGCQGISGAPSGGRPPVRRTIGALANPASGPRLEKL